MSPTHPAPVADAPPKARSWELRSEKIRPEHVERLAVVYVRQSTPQQVLNNQESTRLQYSLKSRALSLGWLEDRVLVIDDDLGKSAASAEGRLGFQRLVSEVGLGHVGMILGVEMSRLARSCRDWHQLLEVCALFGTLIADLDGVYDPGHYNDRLLLGLKGTMSEAELHIIKQRMNQGRLTKARRGELITRLPPGYMRNSSGEVTLDPDEQVQDAVRLIFRKFEELGSTGAVLGYLIEHGIQIGFRPRGQAEVEWRRPHRSWLSGILHNPIYAGAYAFGRKQRDPRQKNAGRPSTGIRRIKPDGWVAFLKDRLPAYISWDQYEANVARLKSNQPTASTPGAARPGPALLAGLVICAKCGCHLFVRYSGRLNTHTYECQRLKTDCAGDFCQRISGGVLDEFISARVVEALAPASLELSLEAAKNLQRERDEITRVWQQRIERARYEAERAARQYRLVEPENRLVARHLERDWEEKLAAQKGLEEESRRFEQSRPRLLSEAERDAIRHLAADIPALWHASTTTDADRKEIIRQVVQRVIVDTEGQSERVGVEVHWVGGSKTRSEMRRPVGRLSQLSYYPDLCERLRLLAEEGLPSAEIARRLHAESYRPPRGGERFGWRTVAGMLRELGLSKHGSKSRTGLGEHEWWLPELARRVPMSSVTLQSWVRSSVVRARQQERRLGRWILWADEAEIARLRELYRRHVGVYGRRVVVGGAPQ